MTALANSETDAYQLGRVAFSEGRVCAPALDPAICALIRGKAHPESLRLMRAWHQGWAEANCAQAIKEEA